MGSSYSDKEIADLISCPKKVKTPPKQNMTLERGNYRNDMILSSQDESLEFKVFIRKNVDFPENFSIGLEYRPHDESGFCLLRCNGPHGTFEGTPETDRWHFYYHLHKAKPANLQAGARAERGGELTKEYASFEDALPYFLKLINVQEYRKYFPKFFTPELSLGDAE